MKSNYPVFWMLAHFSTSFSFLFSLFLLPPTLRFPLTKCYPPPPPAPLGFCFCFYYLYIYMLLLLLLYSLPPPTRSTVVEVVGSLSSMISRCKNMSFSQKSSRIRFISRMWHLQFCFVFCCCDRQEHVVVADSWPFHNQNVAVTIFVLIFVCLLLLLLFLFYPIYVTQRKAVLPCD